jgi:hypothetical protein
LLDWSKGREARQDLVSRPRDYAGKREAVADGGVTSARDLAGVDIVVERGVKYKGQANDRRPSAPVSNLRRSPASAVAVVLTLVLTFSAGASFAAVDAALLTRPPFADPDALVTIGETPVDQPTAGLRAVTYSTFEVWRDRAGSLAATAGTN